MKKSLLSPILLGLVLLFPTPSIAQDAFTTFVYFTGIGCPHCAHVDPVLFKQKVRTGGLMVVEYEIYQNAVNAPLLMSYKEAYNAPLGVPMLLAKAQKNSAVVGDKNILKDIDSLMAGNKGNGVVLPAGAVSFSSLALSDLPGLPKIWFNDRVAERTEMGTQESAPVKAFLLNGMEPQGCEPSPKKRVSLSGDGVLFAKACTFNGWHLLHN
ncbi:MAG: hypothetical protein AB7E52_08880 [Bdellovibrionales bacterium]